MLTISKDRRLTPIIYGKVPGQRLHKFIHSLLPIVNNLYGL